MICNLFYCHRNVLFCLKLICDIEMLHLLQTYLDSLPSTRGVKRNRKNGQLNWQKMDKEYSTTMKDAISHQDADKEAGRNHTGRTDILERKFMNE